MKRSILLTVAVLLLITVTASAQVKPGIRPFVKFSMIAMSLNSDEIQDVDAGFGFGFGAGARIPLGESKFVFLPELTYTDRSSWLRVQEGDRPGALIEQFELQLKHLEVPLMVHWNFSRAEDMSFFLMAGYVASFLMDAKIEDSDGENVETSELETLNDFYSSISLGFGVRAGVVQVDASYRFGLGDVGRVENGGDPRMDAFNFSFGIIF